MTSASSKRNVELDRLRGIAIIFTVVFHTTASFMPKALWFAPAGVDLFFVLSGFVVTTSLKTMLPNWDQNESLITRLVQSANGTASFLIKRSFRILPLSLVVLAFFNIFDSMIGLDSTLVLHDTKLILKGIYNYRLYSPTTFETAPLVPFWTLCLEIQFYLMLPVIFVFFPSDKTRSIFFIACTIVIAALIRPIEIARFHANPTISNPIFFFHFRADALFLGAWLALNQSKFLTYHVSPSRLIRPAVILATVHLWTATHFYEALNLLFTTFYYINLWIVSLVLVFLASQRRDHVLGIPYLSNFLEYLGTRSFSIYLIHMFVFWATRKIWYSNSAISQAMASHPFGFILVLKCVSYLIVLAIATELLYRLIERPFILISQRLVRQNFVHRA
jgi:peptidoglycan/LPS O-acetylase OafA/YrhL